ncbi:autotransporter domain-containing protein [Terricaulis sp.]|uniref:autotransporter domain-containing protein n=1 Tax=Terricaulis sp. TaxID=2768686 RepID=UPI0037836E76
MRILRRIHLAGLVALAGAAGVAEEAKANDVTISTTTSTPVATSAPDTVSPGDVTIANGGNIQITTGETGVTVDSNNDVTIQSGGQITATDEDGVNGIVLENGFTGIITNSGSISLVEDFTQPDTGSDGDLDGPVAIGINRIGIWQQGDFTGDIINTGNINIEGNTSYGVRLDGQLDGDFNHTGSITLLGDDGAAVAVLGGAGGGVTGDLLLRGTLTAHGENSYAALIAAPVGGELRINGVWTGTGYNSTVRLSGDAAANLDADDFLQSAAVLEVRFSVAGGITVEGVGVEDDTDDDQDGITEADGDTDDDLTASMRSFGSAPTIHLIADPSANLVLGDAADGFGLNIRGGVFADSIFDGFSATAIRIEGQGGRIVDTGAGIRNDNFVNAQSYEANAYAAYLGGGALVPLIVNRRAFSAVSVSETDQTAYVVYIASGANVSAINNSGYMRSQLFGEIGDSVVIRDLSNTLATITNSGQILAQIIATDVDPLDGVPPPDITGSSIAIDVSASSIGVTYNQVADVAFNDDDAVDDDSTTRPPTSTIGDILFGTGADTINLLDGTIDGAISFGAGADVFHIDGGFYFGRVTDSDGALSFDVSNGGLVLNGGTLNITQAHFGADGQLGVVLSTVPADTTFINASGTVTFDPGASITPIIPTGLPVSGTYDFLTAGTLVGASNVERTITGAGTPYIYNLAVQVDPGDSNTLQAVFALKTAAELGLNPNQALAFNPIINALRLDSEASQAMSLIDNQYDFNDAYEDLLPTFSSATTELSTTAIQQMQSATTNRLTTIRVQDINEVSVWAQEIGYALNREPETAIGQDFRGYGFGLAGGIDGPLDNGALFGLSVSFITSEMEEPGRPEGQISTTFAQGNAYLGTAFGPVDLDFVGGLGAGRMRERRFVEIGAYSAVTEADWWAFEGHGAVRASVPLRMGWLVMTPQTALTYVGISEQDYEEEGGGAAIDYRADTVFSQRLWGDVGVDFAARWNMRGGAVVSPHVYLGYRANLIDEAADRTFTFVSTGESFTLTDEELGSGGPLIGIGVDATNGYSTFSLAYEGEITDQIERHSLNAAIRFRF